jgi:glycosyltransferase involved in cell wall biosynthesis
MGNVLVTIGVPVRNCEKTIGTTLDSIISQDYPHNLIKIVVVDDGCKDGTIPIIIDKLEKTEIEARIISTGGKGLAIARQMVVNNALGKYIVWVDGDETIPGDYVSKQVNFMELHPSVGKARGKWGWLRTGKVVGDLRYLSYIYYQQDKRGTEQKITGIGCSICRMDAIRDVGGFDLDIKGAAEDVDLAIRMRACGWKFSLTDAFFYSVPKTSWKDLWKQYRWYGYGEHFVNHKHKVNSGLVHLPPVALATGIRKAVAAFKFAGEKKSFLLPIYSLTCGIAWWIGFTKAHFEKYNP